MKTPHPEQTALSENAASLARELDWLSRVITAGIQLYFGQACGYADVREIAPPDIGRTLPLRPDAARTCHVVRRAAAVDPGPRPPCPPQALDPFLIKNAQFDRGFTEFGGVLPGVHSGFWPTLETANFILAGQDLERRFALQTRFDPGHFFAERRMLSLESGAPGQPLTSQALSVGREYLSHFTLGTGYRPEFGSAFPAKRIDTALDWEDLVLADHILDEVEEIKAWIEHRHTLLHDWQLAKKIKPGFRSLFYGPPGTGKTLTASLLGKTTGLDVYRVDLSLVVSKYIGETEKNLANVFDQAQVRDWILFFDEADALFGKRTQTSSSNDRYANQEVSYLLQRVEDFPGVVILATNLKGNMDEAFGRRFQSMIYFPVPGRRSVFVSGPAPFPATAAWTRTWTATHCRGVRGGRRRDHQRVAVRLADGLAARQRGHPPARHPAWHPTRIPQRRQADLRSRHDRQGAQFPARRTQQLYRQALPEQRKRGGAVQPGESGRHHPLPIENKLI